MIKRGQITDWQVLVVDDEVDSIELLSELLEFAGAQVRSANNGKVALEQLDLFRPTLVLTDLSMPVMDGWTLLANIRKRPELANIPVIALTAHAMRGDQERGMAAGFTAYITKPITASTLVDDILERMPVKIVISEQ